MPTLLRVALVLAVLGATSREGLSAPAAPKQVWKGFPDWVTSVALSPDGRWAAAGSYDVVHLWEIATQQPAGVLKTRCGYAHGLAFSPDCMQLVIGGYQQVQVWQLESRQKTGTWRGHKGYGRSVAFSPDGQQVATGSEDRTLRIWNWPTGEEQRVIGPGDHPVLGVAWSPAGDRVASAAGDETRLSLPGQVRVWNAQTGEPLAEPTPHAMAATGVAFAPDGRLLLSTSLDERVHVFHLATGNALGFFGGHSRPVNAIVFPGRSDVAITASGGRFQGGNEIKLFRPEDGTELVSLEGHEAKVSSLAVSVDATLLISGAYDRTVAFWDLQACLPTRDENADSTAETSTSRLTTSSASTVIAETAVAAAAPASETSTMRIGIIGLDTSHAIAFTKTFNAESPAPAVAGCRVVVAYPHGSADIESSTSRIPGYTEEIQKLGVEIVDAIDALVERVDAVLLETNDGRPHLAQVLPVLKARKPVFVDKPIAASLVDAIAIQEAARHYQTPLFSASSLRFLGQAREVRSGEFGPVVGCDTYSPCSLEPTHPDLYWYGIHGVEGLFAVMGPGLQTVSRS